MQWQLEYHQDCISVQDNHRQSSLMHSQPLRKIFTEWGYRHSESYHRNSSWPAEKLDSSVPWDAQNLQPGLYREAEIWSYIIHKQLSAKNKHVHAQLILLSVIFTWGWGFWKWRQLQLYQSTFLLCAPSLAIACTGIKTCTRGSS